MSYELLPFSFRYIDAANVLLVNQVGDFLKISDSDFKKLYSLELEQKDSIFDKLKAKHFLSDSERSMQLALELLSTKLRTKKSFLSDFTALHMIVVTLRCNCCCKYCHASSVGIDKYDYDMNWKTAKNTIDMIFQTPCNEIKIEYQGGEPLLNWTVIKESILYAIFLNKIAKKNLSFVICTNLMLITKKQLLFCKQYKVSISTSLDGARHHHNQNRKTIDNESTYDGFLDKLTLCNTVFKESICSPLLTITRSNLHSLKEIVDHYISLNFKNIFLRTLNPYGNAVHNASELSYSVEEFIDAYIDVIRYIINLNINGTYFIESYTALLLRKILTPFSDCFVDLQSPSGAGISGAIYNYDGEIYPADEGRMLAKMGDKRFCMGNVNYTSHRQAFNGTIIKDIVFNSCLETTPVCSDCVYQQYCGADPIRNYLETKDLMGMPNSDFCKKNKKIFDYLFELILNNDEKIMDVFWSWITYRKYEDIKLEAS